MDALGTLGILAHRVATSTTSLIMEKKFWLQRQKDFTIQQVTAEVGTREAKQSFAVVASPPPLLFIIDKWKQQKQKIK